MFDMDDPQVRKLVITLAVSIALILVLKMVLLKADKVSIAAAKAAAEKNQPAAPAQAGGQPAPPSAVTPAPPVN